MDLSDRKRQILKAIVEGYIETAEPVGSKAIMQSWNNLLSSATIRNEMGELEELGLVEKPHTSAGRVPSQVGYRVYVDELMNSYRLTLREIDDLNHTLQEKMSKLDQIVSLSGKILSELTNHPTISISQHTNKIKIRHFDFIAVDFYSFVLIIVTSGGTVKNRFVRLDYPLSPEIASNLARVFNSFLTEIEIDSSIIDKLSAIKAMAGESLPLAECMSDFIFQTADEEKISDISIDGAAKLLSYPEYHDPDKARELLEFLSDRYNLNSIPLSDVQKAVNFAIGRENEIDELKETSVIYTTYKLPGDLVGIWAVLGPTRMDYAKTSACLEAFVNGINGLLTKNGYNIKTDFPSNNLGKKKRRGDTT